MGFSISLTACRAEDREAFLAQAGLSLTQVADPEQQSRLSAATVGDQFMTWRNERLMKTFDMPMYEEMARDVDFLTLTLNETSMGAEVAFFEHGKKTWSFLGSDDGWTVEGTPPLSMEKLQALVLINDPEHLQHQDDVDEDFYDPFALAVELFVALTGFRYDDVHTDTFYELSGEMPYPTGGLAKVLGSKPWWKFW